MKNEFKEQEINWRTMPTKYVDIDTGEQITYEQAKLEYVIINKKKRSNVHRKTGTIEYTNECRRSRNLFSQ